MFAEIITIGDEILIGQIIDTNSAFLARELNKIGISVYQITSIQDEKEHILSAVEEAASRCRLVLITGGLGPTNDDVTKHSLCEFLGDKLVKDKEVLEHIEMLFEKYISTPISDSNRLQAMVPSTAYILHNAYGTAPGMWLEKNGTIIVSMPGVPFEMQNMVSDQLIPKLVESFETPYIFHKTVLTYGLGESAIALRIADWEAQLPKEVKLAYLPNLGRVRLRLSAKGPDLNILEDKVNDAIEELYGIIGDIIHGIEEDGNLEERVGELLKSKNLSLATAESFTGGKISSVLTSVPGASSYFKGTVVSYATSVKTGILNVSETTIAQNSVVSAEVATEMAVNIRKIMNADIGIATTGNAGPTKGESEAEIGTVYIALSSPGGDHAEKFTMGNHRTRIVEKSVNKALELLRDLLLKI